MTITPAIGRTNRAGAAPTKKAQGGDSGALPDVPGTADGQAAPMPSTTQEETMSVQLTQPCRSISPGLERERRNMEARATIAERNARVSHSTGDLRRAREARLLAERAAQPFLVAA